ncbi:MAG TPA: hypothetical protein VL633_07605 [Bacteroidota bacterium]|nr:hypothetical protein [Bacteroidota bacterium]
MSSRARAALAPYRQRLIQWSTSGPGQQPYWFLLPQWLCDTYGGRVKPHGNPESFLRDVLWAQYCLFLHVRIIDDLFDKQASALSLRMVADDVLIEAERTLLQWMPRNNRSFWSFYRKSLRTTKSAILRVDNLQRSARTSPQTILDLYPRVNSMLKIGSVAVCLRLNRPRMLARIERFMDELAAGSQVLDDLTDLAEDFERSRYNYVALRLIGENGRNHRGRIQLSELSQQMIYSSIGDKILSEVINAFSSAYRVLQPLKIGDANRIARSHNAALMSIREQMLRRRAEILLGVWNERDV